MNKTISIFLLLYIIAGCQNTEKQAKRVVIARVGDKALYYDDIPVQVREEFPEEDSATLIHNYINKWARRELVLEKAEENLSKELKDGIEKELAETRINLIIYEYQQQMILEKMDTVVSDEEMRQYYSANESSFVLTSNIVKALYIKLPVETPNIPGFKTLLKSTRQKDMQELESLCYQFAEKYDDFNENWISLDKIELEMNIEITDQEEFLRKNTYFESADSSSVYLLGISDYRLRNTTAPFEYVKGDIKGIIWNNRRIEFIQNLENGIYNDALKDNGIKIF